MSSISSRDRRHLTNGVKEHLRELSVQLALLNHRVSAGAGLKQVDLDCLDLITRHGPIGPSALARRAGLHPATMTGILDRLQKGGWIVRERDPEAADRRAVTLRAVKERMGEIYRLFGGMNAAMDELCEEYTPEELEVIAGFLRRTTDAGQEVTADLV
ncbi:MarR family transcriptional regulator [Actinorhabdospora filicis]|uniref:MarR family transcriptional regulator n=1 Tax=Actinorhabdospora filicis TaxID=1785913 RepID=A0A9W6SJ99_9ACTN|nr:MarR family transcriptional regulator [Actinorhabdospora filicis]GLZ76980.1 MarR family transcriptional regulator [Actinorhabdospora filicis]